MPNLNCWHGMGHLTRDPEEKYTQAGLRIVKWTLAVSRKYKDKEEVSFIDCTAFDKLGGVVSQYCHKGSPLYVQGRIKQDNWRDKDTGAKRSKLGIVVDSVQLLKGRGDNDRQPDRDRELSETYEEEPHASGQFDDKPGDEVPF